MSNKVNIKPFHVMDILARCKEMEAQGIDVIHMEIGEPDFATPQPIINAGIQALKENRTHYTSAVGLLELRQKICCYYQDAFSISVSPDQIIITPGASGALQLVLSHVLQDKKSIMVCDPTYPCNNNVTQLLGGNVVAVSVDEETDYQLTLDLVKNNWNGNISAVLVSSPSNPTGTISKRDQLIGIADFLIGKGASLIVDEIYQGLTYGVDSETVANARENIFVLNSFSKYFGMTGWRIGWLCAPTITMTQLDAIAQNTYLASSTIAQHAALAAFASETLEVLEERRKAFLRRRDILCQSLTELGILVRVIPQGAFYVYADISNFSNDSFTFCKHLLEKTGLAITPGCDFGNTNAEKYVRFAYTISEKRIEQGMHRLKAFLRP